MKKIYLCVLALAFSAVAISAQTFKKGDFVANAGLGFNSSGLSAMVPSIGVGLEYGLLNNLCDEKAGIGVGVGGGVNFARYGWNLPGLPEQGRGGGGVNYITLAAKGNFHYEFVDKLDTYVGLSLNFLFGQGIGFGAQIGARYYFIENLAAYAEIGDASTGAGLEIGIACKF